MKKHPASRAHEIDLLRGIAILLMILFHLIFDLNYFFGFRYLSFDSGFWFYVGRIAAILFILLSGISTVLFTQHYTDKQFWPKMFKRTAQVALFALLITLVSWLLIPQQVILFGILHFLTISILLSVPFLWFKKWNIVLGILILSISSWITQMPVTGSWLIPLGFAPDFYTLDYYPLLPWFGVTLLGVGIGHALYQEKSFSHRILLKNTGLEYIGRRSLMIYLIHQPILLGLLILIFGLPKW